jgi:hypothetical protein
LVDDFENTSYHRNTPTSNTLVMPTPSTSDLPKPKSWDEFEDIVWSIYIQRWQDPHAQRYGRNGQAQHGVDIYGQQNGSSKYVAVQCKAIPKNKPTA